MLCIGTLTMLPLPSLIFWKKIIEITWHLIIQASFVNIGNTWKNTIRSKKFFREFWLLFMYRYDICLFQFNVKLWIVNLGIYIIACVFCKKNRVFLKMFAFLSLFWNDFLGTRFWIDFLMSSMLVSLNARRIGHICVWGA